MPVHWDTDPGLPAHRSPAPGTAVSHHTAAHHRIQPPITPRPACSRIPCTPRAVAGPLPPNWRDSPQTEGREGPSPSPGEGPLYGGKGGTAGDTGGPVTQREGLPHRRGWIHQGRDPGLPGKACRTVREGLQRRGSSPVLHHRRKGTLRHSRGGREGHWPHNRADSSREGGSTQQGRFTEEERGEFPHSEEGSPGERGVSPTLRRLTQKERGAPAHDSPQTRGIWCRANHHGGFVSGPTLEVLSFWMCCAPAASLHHEHNSRLAYSTQARQD